MNNNGSLSAFYPDFSMLLWDATRAEIAASNEDYRMPKWVTIGGTYRIRHELQEGRFREGRTGGDQALVERLFPNARGELGSFYLGGELEDARASS